MFLYVVFFFFGNVLTFFRLVEVPVSPAVGVSGFSLPQRPCWGLCLPVPQLHPHFGCGSAPCTCRSVFSGHRLLFPGWVGFAPQVFPTARWGGGLAGLVPLPCPHLLPSADDGSCFVPVGGQESPQKLHPHDSLQSSLKRDYYNNVP